jgi:hypothetical protein
MMPQRLDLSRGVVCAGTGAAESPRRDVKFFNKQGEHPLEAETHRNDHEDG